MTFTQGKIDQNDRRRAYFPFCFNLLKCSLVTYKKIELLFESLYVYTTGYSLYKHHTLVGI